VILLAVVAILSWFPVRNMASPSQAMNASFDPFRLVNTYGAFGTVGRIRDEVVVEGTHGDPGDEDGWREYAFRPSPVGSDASRRRSPRTTIGSTG
jgi:hypothetical protein